jgi:hypothetical protein
VACNNLIRCHGCTWLWGLLALSPASKWAGGQDMSEDSSTSRTVAPGLLTNGSYCCSVSVKDAQGSTVEVIDVSPQLQTAPWQTVMTAVGVSPWLARLPSDVTTGLWMGLQPSHRLPETEQPGATCSSLTRSSSAALAAAAAAGERCVRWHMASSRACGSVRFGLQPLCSRPPSSSSTPIAEIAARYAASSITSSCSSPPYADSLQLQLGGSYDGVCPCRV